MPFNGDALWLWGISLTKWATFNTKHMYKTDVQICRNRVSHAIVVAVVLAESDRFIPALTFIIGANVLPGLLHCAISL